MIFCWFCFCFCGNRHNYNVVGCPLLAPLPPEKKKRGDAQDYMSDTANFVSFICKVAQTQNRTQTLNLRVYDAAWFVVEKQIVKNAPHTMCGKIEKKVRQDFFAESVVCSAVEMGQRCAVFTNIHDVLNLGKKGEFPGIAEEMWYARI